MMKIKEVTTTEREYMLAESRQMRYIKMKLKLMKKTKRGEILRLFWTLGVSRQCVGSYD